MSNTFWYIAAAVLTVIGVLGTLLPALPGVPLVFAGLALAAWVGDFREISGWTVAVLGLLTALSVTVDLAASAFGARIAGASGWAFAGAALGTVVGLFFAPIGLFVGPFLGALALEWLHTRQLRGSLKAGAGASVGVLIGTVVRVALAFTMLALFALAWWWP